MISLVESGWFTILMVFIQFFLDYILLKYLVGRIKFQKKEFILLLFCSLVTGSLFLFIGSTAILFLVLLLQGMAWFFIDEKKLYISGYLAYALIIVIIFDHISSIIDIYFLGHETNVDMIFLEALFHLAISYSLSFVCVFLILNLKILFIKKFPFINELTLVICIIGIYMLVIYYVSIFLGKYLGNNTEIITLNLVFLLFIFYFLC